jgi:hypothetical protein
MKNQAFLLVRPQDTIMLVGSESFDFLLKCIFYKNPSLIKVAKAIFEETARKGYYDANQWRAFIRKHDVGQSGYYAVISRLTGLGLVKRKRRRYYIANGFSRFLSSSARVWDENVRSWKVKSLFETF